LRRRARRADSRHSDRSVLTQIRQGGKIFLGPIRRNCPYIHSVALEVVAARARPAAQRLDLEIGLRPRSELNGCRLAEIDPVARHRESVGSRCKIAQEHSAGQAFTHRHAVRGDNWRGQAFPRLELAQESDPRQPRVDRWSLRYRCRQCRPGHVAGQCLEADSDQHGSHQPDSRCHFSFRKMTGRSSIRSVANERHNAQEAVATAAREIAPSNDRVSQLQHPREQKLYYFR